MEVQTKETKKQKLALMKFRFDSPPLELSAPVLQDRTVGYSVLRQNCACVFLDRMLDDIMGQQAKGPQLAQQQPFQHQQQQQQQIVQVSYAQPQQPVQQLPRPPLVDRGRMCGYADGPRPQVPVQAGQQQLVTQSQQHDYSPRPQRHQLASPIAEGPCETYTLPASTVIEPVTTAPRPLPPPVVHQSPSETPFASPAIQSNLTSATPAQPSLPSLPQSMPTLTEEVQPPKEQDVISPVPNAGTTTVSAQDPKVNVPMVPQTSPAPAPKSIEDGPPTPVQPDKIEKKYPALKSKELEKLMECRYCYKKVHFVSELLVHLKKHSHDVDSVAESLSVWTGGRKLRCHLCKNKSSYSLSYAKHLDEHVIPGLQCPSCSCCDEDTASPAKLSRHMEIHHPSVIFAEGTQPKVVIEPPLQDQNTTLPASANMLSPPPCASLSSNACLSLPNTEATSSEVQKHKESKLPTIEKSMPSSPLVNNEVESPLNHQMMSPVDPVVKPPVTGGVPSPLEELRQHANSGNDDLGPSQHAKAPSQVNSPLAAAPGQMSSSITSMVSPPCPMSQSPLTPQCPPPHVFGSPSPMTNSPAMIPSPRTPVTPLAIPPSPFQDSRSSTDVSTGTCAYLESTGNDREKESISAAEIDEEELEHVTVSWKSIL